MDKRLYDLLETMTSKERAELYVLLRQLIIKRNEKKSWDMTADLMRRLMDGSKYDS